ncbi:sugar ABC transporter permease [Clostridium sp. WB02_MRS01]|uniref:carbohydrate ABC transporter permease n=1 Tax=Clostridium sp. WB02_MRS01 TaxID=2605777 RepID=UPI0012B1BB0B|nr:sugar ABC transporter permease [Clostridium sp. WB02_MRS01]MSS08569.1 sugar ABC transporter permease [Clostridium sp. WB02_MRS01]
MKKRAFHFIEPYLYLLPAFSMLLLFTYYPFVQNAILSLFTVNKFREIKEFAGLANYVRVLTDEKFLRAMGNTFIYVFTTVPISIVFGFALALLARRHHRISIAYEALFALSMAVSASVIAMIFQLAYNPSMGIINKLSGISVSWLTDPKSALLSLIIVQIWSNIGYNFIFLFSALRGLSDEVLESAQVDGAVGIKLLGKILIPLVSPTLLFLLVKDIAYAMTTASLTLILTTNNGATGQPNGATETIMSYIYGKAIIGTNYNAAFAATMVGFILAAIMMVFSLILDKKKVNYD